MPSGLFTAALLEFLLPAIVVDVDGTSSSLLEVCAVAGAVASAVAGADALVVVCEGFLRCLLALLLSSNLCVVVLLSCFLASRCAC